jgi:hypothetical protein
MEDSALIDIILFCVINCVSPVVLKIYQELH